ncbi:MAG TPA: hypothetical protein VMG09_16730 [Bacteroidota bacterium]|nr:hypothetical protein [Bacteroidota bacterium]
MESRHCRTSIAIGSFLMLILAAIAFVPSTTMAQQHYEGYYLFMGSRPDNEEPFYSDNVQGLTHDTANWFITQEKDLWKIPATYDLTQNGVGSSDPGVIHVNISDDPIGQLGHSHFGDPDYYKGYLLVPTGFKEDQPNGILLFKGSDLTFLGSALLPTGVEDGGWVAVDKAGYIYTSPDNLTSVQKYSLRWDLVPGEPQGFTLSLTLVSDIPVVDENGAALNLGLMGGGVFSPSNDLIYIVTGGMCKDCPDGVDIDVDWMKEHGGIHVLDTRSQPWRRVQKSTNGSGYFNYMFEPGLLGGCDEPEGLTYWDLDSVTNVNASMKGQGQLHVFMLDNDIDQDDASLYHYTNTIHVNGASTGDETGTYQKPFKTVGGANSLAWYGARVKIQAGSYAESLTFSKQIQVLASGGTARVGSIGQFSLTPSARINLYSGGAMKLTGQ